MQSFLHTSLDMLLKSHQAIVGFHTKLVHEARKKDRTQKMVLPAAPFFEAALDHSADSISVPVLALHSDPSSQPL